MSSTSHLRNIQLLRAVAAMAVVMQHALHDSDSLSAAQAQAPPDQAWFNFGFGVNIFFVISGFIMAYAGAAEFGKAGAPLRFLGRRVARIVPLYWVLTTVMLVGAMIAPSLLNVPVGGIAHILASYLFIPDARLPGEIRPVLALGWTLNYEMYFYVLFAFALLLPMRLAIATLTVSMVGLAASGAFFHPAQTPIAFWTDPIILDFLLGIYVALLLRAGIRISGALAGLAAALGLVGFVHPEAVGLDPSVIPPWLSGGLPALILVGAAAIGPPVPLRRLTAAGVALGNASYSLYLIHPFVVRPLRALCARLIGAQMPPWAFVLCCCLAAGAMATMVYHMLERPLTARVQNWLGPASAPDAVPAPGRAGRVRSLSLLGRLVAGSGAGLPSAQAPLPLSRGGSAPWAPGRRRVLSVRSLERGLLFLLTASGFLAFVEPSPYEAVFALVLVVFLCTGGLRLTSQTLPLLCCLFGFSLGGFICLTPYLTEPDSISFTMISAYMCLTAVFYATLLSVDAAGRLDALRKGYVLAATLASLAGIVGYFHFGDFLGPLTRYDRASGTFKDPNVLGTFVILPLVYLVRSMFVSKVRSTTLLWVGTILFGGVFLSFSRGAWIHAAGSVALMTVLTYLATSSGRVRRRIVTVAASGIVVLAVALPVVLSVKSVGTVFEERASFDQSYDLGEQGRFGNQINSIPLLLDRPNGFGPHRFHIFFPEDPHEVYLNAFASYGWLGGFSYLVLIVMTILIGWRIATKDFPLRGHAIAIWSTLFVQIVQGMQIDTDHWRHFWLMLGLTWGMLPVLRLAGAGALPASRAPGPCQAGAARQAATG